MPTQSTQPAAERTESSSPQPGDPTAHPFLTGVSGRHFVDQFGRPYLANWETAWFVFSQLPVEDQVIYLADRKAKGFNGVITAWFATAAGPDIWTTYDDMSPYLDGDISSPNPVFWDRMDASIDLAAEYGMTVMLGMATTDVFNGSPYDATLAQCEEFGRQLGERYKDKPNIAYLIGVDYDPQDWAGNDPKFDAVLTGIRNAGDTHPATVQLYNSSSSMQDPFWAGKYQFEDLYTYPKTYAGALAAYNNTQLPIFGGEYNFEDENNEGGPPTDNQTLRRQVGWSLTSGLTGWTYGRKAIWRLDDDWKAALNSAFVIQNQRIYERFSPMAWEKLVPVQDGSLITAGAGDDPTVGTQNRNDVDPLESDHATSAVASDHSFAVAYVPTARTLSVDTSQVNALSSSYWVDATDASLTVPAEFAGSSVTTPGKNAAGDEDWFLVLQGSPIS